MYTCTYYEQYCFSWEGCQVGFVRRRMVKGKEMVFVWCFCFLSLYLYHIPPTFTAVTCNNVIHQFTAFTSVNICKSHFGGFFLKTFFLAFYFLDFPQFAANLIFGLFQCWQKSVGVFMVDLFVFLAFPFFLLFWKHWKQIFAKFVKPTVSRKTIGHKNKQIIILSHIMRYILRLQWLI